jgi:sugar/nucleoside kinase (ribokinase family)
LLELDISYVIITQGENGAILGCGNSSNLPLRLYSIPAYSVDIIIDETGAGDAFLIAFIAFLQLLDDELEAIAFATSIASLLVENRFDSTKFSVENIAFRQETIRSHIKLIDSES